VVIQKLVYRFDGRGYLKDGHYHLFVLPADGGTPHQLTQGAFDHVQCDPEQEPDAPVWTPDGQALLITANRHPDAEYDYRNTEVYEVFLANGTVKALTDRAGPDEHAALSPDGRTIAYLGYDDKPFGYQPSLLHLMNRDGSGKRILTLKLDRDVQK